MNYKILILIFGFIASSLLSGAQDFGSAIVIKNSDIGAAYGKNFTDALHKSFVKAGGTDFQFYTWKGGNDKPILYAPLKNKDIKEPVSYTHLTLPTKA